ncbi:MAG TPA: autotransporter outer membrane beta-barrel domain-containing protein, partial [Sphingomicrobium sp.]|nr:autotransporter outer membrane beta-barrel domain-containing protein [Sphingomicrobium sp.]
VALFAQAAVPAVITPAIVSLGATGGSGNDGGVIDLSFTGGFMTAGARANGLIVQSIGGGGGEVVLDGLQAASVILGGQAGANGSGGNVTVSNNGQVTTLGEAANGILLQSIGGGGGALFGAGANPSLTLSSANSGNGGAILLSQTGDVAVLGDGAYGILAQSLGGGGGLVDGVFAGTAGGVGLGGAVGLDIDGGILAFGVNSTAVMAQSLGSLGGSNITIGASGDVRGGSGSGVGIALDGGATNLVTIESSLSAVSGRAMTGTYGNDRLENEGLTVGNILLGGGTNLVHTAVGASFLTIDTLDLRDGAGSSGLFDNDGTLLMGLAADPVPIDLLNGATFAPPVITNPKTDLLVGTSVISLVALDGNFRQSGSGLMNYDVAFGPYVSDRIDATGSAAVDGTADITLTWLENNDNVTLISTGQGGTDNGLDPVDTLAIDYGILANSAGIHLTLATDFAQDFLNHNQRQIARHLDSSVEVGGAGGIGRLLALIGNLTAGQEDLYAGIFAELDPESLLAPTIAQLDSARDFGPDVMGCQPGDERGAKCVFGRVDGHHIDRNGGEMDVDFATSARLRVGGAISAGNGWRVGAALGFDDLGSLEADNGRTNGTGGSGFHAGFGVGKLFANERGEASLALTVGNQQFETDRYQNIFQPGIGHAKIKTRYFGASAGLGYTLSSGRLFATPGIDLQAIHMRIGDFAESGLGGTGARSDGTSDWYLSATPKLTAGIKSGVFKVSGTVGYQLSDKGKIVAPIRLVGSPDASDPAMIRTLIDKEMLMLGVNAEVQASSSAAFQFGFKGLYGDRVDSESANVKLVVRF